MSLDELYSVAKEAYDLREAMFGADGMRELEKVVMLKVVDNKWIEHLDHMDMLREGITLRAYGQRDPLIEYKIRRLMFERMIANIQEEIARNVFQVNIVVQPEDHLKDAKEVHADISAEEDNKKPGFVNGETTGRNDLCPCGSGKNLKNVVGQKINNLNKGSNLLFFVKG